MAQVPNTGSKPNGAAGGPVENAAASEPSGLDDIFEADNDMYEADDAGDGGAADGDAGDGGGAADRTVSETPARQIEGAEPEFPGVQFPQQQRPQQPSYDPDNPRGFQRVGTLFADAQGNIVSRDGRVMAAKGEPARHWFNMSKQVTAGQHAVRQVEALQKQIEDNGRLIQQAREISELPQRMGISREDYNAGVQLVAAWNKDPLTVARDMVARTMARGFNATDILGNDAGNAIEMTALRQMLNEATAPSREREQQIRVDTENRQTAERNYNEFMARYPMARAHQSLIATLMRENKITATEAYHELRYFALENQLDFEQPLGPQIEARRGGQQPPQRQQQPGPGDVTYRAPMVAGNGGGRRDHLTNEPAMADANASWSDILDSVMRRSA